MVRRIGVVGEVAEKVDEAVRDGIYKTGGGDGNSADPCDPAQIPGWVAALEGDGTDLPPGAGGCRPLGVEWEEDQPWPRCHRIDCRRCWAACIHGVSHALDGRLAVAEQLRMPPPMVGVRVTTRPVVTFGAVSRAAAALMIDVLDWFVYDVRRGRCGEDAPGRVHGGWAGHRLTEAEGRVDLRTYEVFVHETGYEAPPPARDLGWRDWRAGAEVAPAGFLLPPPPRRRLATDVSKALTIDGARRQWWRKCGCIYSSGVRQPGWGGDSSGPPRKNPRKPSRPRPGGGIVEFPDSTVVVPSPPFRWDQAGRRWITHPVSGNFSEPEPGCRGQG